MSLMILTKTDGDFPVNSYMILTADTARIIVPWSKKEIYTTPDGYNEFNVEYYTYKGKTVQCVAFDYTWLVIAYGYKAREATEEQLKAFLSNNEYHPPYYLKEEEQ